MSAIIPARLGNPKGLLSALTELIEAGKVTPVIDRRYPFTDISDAVSYQEDGHAAGKVVVTVPAGAAAP